jgi:ABC-type glycerol-3-phosphate transport system substrate-binding protein
MGSLATRLIALGLTATLATGALTACTGSSGEVVVYGATSEEVIQEWVQQFEEDSGVTVNYFRVPSNQLHQRWSQETEAGQHTADVIISSLPSEMVVAADHGWLAEISPDDADSYDEAYTIPNRAYPLYLGLDVIGWNTNETPRVSCFDRAVWVNSSTANGTGGLLSRTFGRVALNSPITSSWST